MANLAVHLKSGEVVNLESGDFSLYDPEEGRASNTSRRRKAFGAVQGAFSPQEVVNEDGEVVSQFDSDSPYIQGYKVGEDKFAIIPTENVSYTEFVEVNQD